MKIQILVRSADWLNSAGTRIRYVRLKRELNSLGWHLAIDPVASINDGLRLNADIYLFSKCQDAGALMLAEMLREAGALVGFDLFDDYFSGQDSLTFAHRAFQRALIGKVDFLLCSTERMATIARMFHAGVPVHVMNDPHEPIATPSIVRSVGAKLARARENRTLEVVWFGHGNNPVFPVGLNDAVGFGVELEVLRQAGWEVRLNILTNPDALDKAVFGALQSLPVQVLIEEWTEAGEAAALDRAVVAFLPVNYQNFSIAKSLNRAVSAMASGAQVFSPGFPLYEALDPFVYRSIKELVDDLAGSSLRLNEGSLDGLGAIFNAIADPAHEATGLVGFFGGLTAGPALAVGDRVMRGIIHGSSSPPAVHRLCTSMGWLSLGSPFSRFHQPFHAEIAQFEPGGSLELRVSREGYTRLADAWRDIAQPLNRSTTGYSYVVPLPDSPAGCTLAAAIPEMWSSRAARILSFPSLMHATSEVYREVYKHTRLLLSELEAPLTVLRSDQEIGR